MDEEEWKVMKEQPVISEHILQAADLHPIVLQVARSCYERIDGNGYPDGLAGEQIPLPAQIVRLADAYVAMTEAMRPLAVPATDRSSYHGVSVGWATRTHDEESSDETLDRAVQAMRTRKETRKDIRGDHSG